MKNKQRYIDILFVIVITTVTCLFLFNSGLVNGDDLHYHLYRLVGLKDAFSEGQFLPKIYPYANYGFGYASPLFYCDLFLYPFALLYKQGISLVVSYKALLVCLTLITTTISLYVSRKVTTKKYTPYIITVLYICSNYRFVNMISRAAIGEMFAMAFIPLCLLSIYKILVKKENCYLLLSIGFSCLTMSHILSLVIVSFFFLISIFVFIFKNRSNKTIIIKQLICILKGVILTLLITAWYLLPMLEQMLDQEFWFSHNNYFPELSKANLTTIFKVFADMKGAQTTSSASAGLIILLLPILYIFEKKDSVVNYVLSVSVVLFIFASGTIIIDGMIKIIQFSFRLYALLVPLLLYVVGYVFDNLENRIVHKIVVSISILYCVLNVIIVNKNAILYAGDKYNNNATKEMLFGNENSPDNGRNIYYNDDELSDGQYRPYEFVNYLKSATKYICYIDKNNQPIETIYDYKRNYSSFEFTTSFENDETLELPILWYKGYKGYEIVWKDGNHKYVPVKCYMNSNNKKVLLDIEKGNHTYYVAYQGTGLQKLTLAISSISVFSLAIFVFIRKRLKSHH